MTSGYCHQSNYTYPLKSKIIAEKYVYIEISFKIQRNEMTVLNLGESVTEKGDVAG
jgi:hypothetical protein